VDINSTEEVDEVLLAIYNNAILLNQDLLTTKNAQILNSQFANFIAHFADAIVLKRRYARLQSEFEKLRVPSQRPQPNGHGVIFLIYPFEGCEYFLEAAREVVEDRWGWQLLTGADWQFDPVQLENVRKHIERADGFLINLTGLRPNVLFETGMVRFDPGVRPVVYAAEGVRDHGEYASNLARTLLIEYDDVERSQLADHLEREMKKIDTMTRLLARERPKYVSARRLKSTLPKGVSFSDQVLADLVLEYPTSDDWKNATADRFATLTNMERLLAERVLESTRNKLA
jgi:molecular chaperone HtpG